MLALLALNACAPVDRDGFSVTDDLRPAFEAAAASWCNVAGLCAHEGGDSGIYESHSDLGGFVGLRTAGPDGTSIIKIDVDVDPYWWPHIIAHELGHHFGCHVHSANEADLMHAYLNEVWAPTEADVACVDR